MAVTGGNVTQDTYQGSSPFDLGKDPNIESGSFSSSCLSNYSYNHLNNELTLTFRKDGAVHVYTDIPKSTFEGLKSASSKGQYFNAVIRIG